MVRGTASQQNLKQKEQYMAEPTWMEKLAKRGVIVSTKKNIKESKLSVGIIGEPKSGKTHFAFTFPKPIVCFYTDLNTQTADGFVQDYDEGEIVLIKPPSVQGKPRAEDWVYYAQSFVPMVQNREFEAATIVIDSYSFLAERLVAHIQGSGDNMTIPGWGRVLTTHIDRMTALLSATQPIPGKRNYNIVVNCHLKAVTDKNDVLEYYAPAIQGAFHKEFVKCFGTVLISRAVAKQDIVDGKMQTIGQNHFCWTIPPMEGKYFCGDGVGGKAGRKALPPKVENTYDALCKAWGVSPGQTQEVK
jgi:hypothetical protein